MQICINVQNFTIKYLKKSYFCLNFKITVPTTVLLFRILFVVFILLLIDFYAFSGFKAAFSTIQIAFLKKNLSFFYWSVTICYLIALTIFILNFKPGQGANGILFRIIGGGLVLIWLPKLIFAIFLLFEDIYRLINAATIYIYDIVGWESKGTEEYFSPRRSFFSKIALAIAAIPFSAILYGITKGKYNFKVNKITLKYKNLPISFDGFTITQISDVHSGSFDSIEGVEKGIKLINELNSDIVLFTGDLVNNIANEFDPYITLFSQIAAPLGKFSITGNHDYGEYIPWVSREAKESNFKKLIENHGKAGFKILLNDHIVFNRDGQQLAIIGVENWGLPPFPQYGDINKASENMTNDIFKVLMSHDPSHWDAQIRQHPLRYDLTLSGHTHGMQFGVEIPGFFKWSPVKYKYPRWAGLYEENDKKLYVNRGFGFIGFPGRVGIWPEITQITLQRG